MLHTEGVCVSVCGVGVCFGVCVAVGVCVYVRSVCLFVFVYVVFVCM